VQIDATSRPLSKFSECANLTKTGAGQHQVLMQESNAKEGRTAAPGEANPKARWVWARPQGWGAGAFGLPFRGRFDMRLSLGSFLSSL
jgi:hypothetical protein